MPLSTSNWVMFWREKMFWNIIKWGSPTCICPIRTQIFGFRPFLKHIATLCPTEHHPCVCAAACPDGLHGEGCEQRCQCDHGTNCHHVTGRCECHPGWREARCDKRECDLDRGQKGPLWKQHIKSCILQLHYERSITVEFFLHYFFKSIRFIWIHTWDWDRYIQFVVKSRIVIIRRVHLYLNKTVVHTTTTVTV